MIIVLAHSHLNTPHPLSPSFPHRIHVTVMKRDHYASTGTGTGTGNRQISPNKMRWKENCTKETEVAAAAAVVAAAVAAVAAVVAAAAAAAAVAAAMVVTNIYMAPNPENSPKVEGVVARPCRVGY